MKKSFMLILITCLLVIAACSSAKTQSLEEFYNDKKIGNIDRIIFLDGSTDA